MGFKVSSSSISAITSSGFSSQIWDLKLQIEKVRLDNALVLAAKYGI